MKAYFIADRNFYNHKDFLDKVANIYIKKPFDLATLRYKNSSDFEYENLARDFIGLSKELNFKSFIHEKLHLAKKLKPVGIHLTSTQFNDIKKAKELNLKVIISTHFKNEAIMAQNLNADAITFSPIFHSPNKKNPVGLDKLKEIVDTIQINCYALGGIITKEQILACKKVGASGFASIRYFFI